MKKTFFADDDIEFIICNIEFIIPDKGKKQETIENDDFSNVHRVI